MTQKTKSNTQKKKFVYYLLGLSLGGIFFLLLIVGITSFLWQILSYPPATTSSNIIVKLSESTVDFKLRKAGGCDEIGKSVKNHIGYVDQSVIIENDLQNRATVDVLPDKIVITEPYLFNISDGKIEILDITDLAEIKTVSTIYSPRIAFEQIIVYGDTIVAYGSAQDSGNNWRGYVEFWDIADKYEPVLINGWRFDGKIENAGVRRGNIYLVLKTENTRANWEESASYREYQKKSKDISKCTDVWISESTLAEVYTSIISWDLGEIDKGFKSKTIFGLGGKVYIDDSAIMILSAYDEYSSTVLEGVLGEIESFFTPGRQPVEMTGIARFEYTNDGTVDFASSTRIAGGHVSSDYITKKDGHYYLPVVNSRFSTHRNASVYIINEELEVQKRIDSLADNAGIYKLSFIADYMYVILKDRHEMVSFYFTGADEYELISGQIDVGKYADNLLVYEDMIVGVGVDANSRNGQALDAGIVLGSFVRNALDGLDTVSELEIGGYGSTAEVLEHRVQKGSESKWFALSVLVVPVEGVSVVEEPVFSKARNRVEYQGVVFFELTDEGEINVLGRVTHHNSTDFSMNGDGLSVDEDKVIDSALLYRGNILLFSKSKITVHELPSLFVVGEFSRIPDDNLPR